MEASLTCTVWTCGDWMTEGWAAWITPCTWTVWPLGSCTSVTVGLLEETWAAAIDAWNTRPHRHRGDKQIWDFRWSVKTTVDLPGPGWCAGPQTLLFHHFAVCLHQPPWYFKVCKQQETSVLCAFKVTHGELLRPHAATHTHALHTIIDILKEGVA